MIVSVIVDGEGIATFTHPLDAWRYVGLILELEPEQAMQVQFKKGLHTDCRTRGDFTGEPNAHRWRTGNRYWSSSRMAEAKTAFLRWAQDA
jgi:hypothetical protein